MISFTNVTKQYGAQVLFVDASFQVNAGEKVGLVGPNGSGKTTIFRLITGEESADDGNVERPRKLRIGYFRQDVGDMRGRSVLAETIAGAGEVAALGEELAHARALKWRRAKISSGRSTASVRCRRATRSSAATRSKRARTPS